MRAAPPPGSACRPWAAPRTTQSFCRTQISTAPPRTSSAPPTARRANAAWPCLSWSPWARAAAEALRERLLAEIDTLKVGLSTDPAAEYGPVVSRAHRQRIVDYIGLGVEEGAELVVDGRGFSLQGYEDGFFVGPSLFDRVTPDMRSYQDEIFGPVLQIVRARSFEDALALPTRHAYGNGVAIFTRDGRAAREFASRVQVGMVGINVPIPVPVAYHSFGGWKRSAFGDANQHGMEGVRFYTKMKTVTARWPRDDGEAASFVMPRMA